MQRILYYWITAEDNRVVIKFIYFTITYYEHIFLFLLSFHRNIRIVTESTMTEYDMNNDVRFNPNMRQQ